MKVTIEISNPHYHPGPGFEMAVTKKRDLSVPPNWVANERIELFGKSYAIIMPPRETELLELEQEPHIHLPEYLTVLVNGKEFRVKVKVSPHEFAPVIHFDSQTAEREGITDTETTL